MESQAPAVVAVVVTRDPGAWFDEVLASWAAVHYDELAVLILDAGGREDPTERVAEAVPDAFVRRLPAGGGFGAAANEVLGMVEGAAFFLLCHDDCAPAPDAVHRMVEESFRSNAGVITPKMTRWDDPEVLLHVGMGADKAGAVFDRVQVGEVDHGQHDAVRDVFVAPGGCTLIRADLFAELGGFDPTITAMGEDLDLSWRAQIAGARVMVAPAATVRHLEALSAGLRPPPPDRRVPSSTEPSSTEPSSIEPSSIEPSSTEPSSIEPSSIEPSSTKPAPADARGATDAAVTGEAAAAEPPEGNPDGPDDAPPSLLALRRRHELWTVLKCYGTAHLVRVLPQMAVLALGELFVALFTGERARAAAVVGAWR
jgi:GT2 family glycosyltransferase